MKYGALALNSLMTHYILALTLLLTSPHLLLGHFTYCTESGNQEFEWFNLYLDPNFEEIPDPKREILNFTVAPNMDISVMSQVTFSNLDGSTCIKTQIFVRI